MAGEQAVAKQRMTSLVHPESSAPSEMRIFADTFASFDGPAAEGGVYDPRRLDRATRVYGSFWWHKCSRGLSSKTHASRTRPTLRSLGEIRPSQ